MPLGADRVMLNAFPYFFRMDVCEDGEVMMTTEFGQPLADLISKCWSESFEKRPSFSKIFSMLKKLTKGE